MINNKVIAKLEEIKKNNLELENILANLDIDKNIQKYQDLSKKIGEKSEILNLYQNYLDKSAELVEIQEMIQDRENQKDPSIIQYFQQEVSVLESNIQNIANLIMTLLLPKDKDDNRNVFLEIRAGTGGEEATLFCADLYRMYCRYAEINNWQINLFSASNSEQGFREIIIQITGKTVYQKLKYESGCHRVQRVPKTESSGRIHTSAATVAVLPQVEEIDSIEIDRKDLRIDTFRASGAGGQHVNKTDSAVRISHIPTGIVIECQQERSQHKNKAMALALLRSRLLSYEKEKQKSQQSEHRKELVGSGDRSDKIRTYNFPQNRVTDHRINLTVYSLEQFLDGNINKFVEALQTQEQLDKLKLFDLD